MNPFDMPGPEFLLLYFSLLAGVTLFACFLRWSLRDPATEPSEDMLELEPYEIAYLAGAEQGVIHTAAATLVQRGHLRLDATNRTVTAGNALPENAPEAERVMYEKVSANPGGVRALELLMDSTLRKLASQQTKRLRDHELLMHQGDYRSYYVWPTILMIAVLVFGAIKLCVGISRNKPVGFLVAGLFVGGILTVLVAFTGRTRRSRRGDIVLNRLRQQNAALRTNAGKSPASVGTQDLALAAALFGLGIFAGTALAELHSAFRPVSSGNGTGSSCSSSSCGGGGGCGSGCGGCGGGGGD